MTTGSPSPGQAANQPVLACHQLTRRIATPSGDRALFVDVDLSLSAGDLVLLRGPSGSGKTSLLRCLVGLDPLDGGTLTLDGAVVGAGDGVKLRGAVCYVAQTPRVVADSVRAYLEEPAGYKVHRQRALDRAWLASLLSTLDLADDVGKQSTARLSGGERKRLAFARALLYHHRGMLLDEPVAGLDPRRAQALLGLLLQFVGAGGAAVVASHELAAAALSASCVWEIDDQRVVVRNP